MTRQSGGRGVLLGVVLLCARTAAVAQEPEAKPNEQQYYERAHPYLDEPLEKLRKTIPELNKTHPVAEGAALPEILRKTGQNVDEFFHDVVDLVAQERITQRRLRGEFGQASARLEDSYLILRQSKEEGAKIVEYHMDPEGHPLDPAEKHPGFLVTFGFALICNYFSTVVQPQSVFRLIGEERLGTSETYVVAFAQQPGRAELFVTMASRGGGSANLLMQGIAWVDKSDYQIIRIRTDLLAPRPDVGLDRQTTEVTLTRVQLQDVAAPLWLPKQVRVYMDVRGQDIDGRWANELRFQNEHLYSNYRRYRVAVKLVTPQ